MTPARPPEPHPLVQLLFRRARRWPDRPAICFRRGASFVTWSWSELRHRALAGAAGLRARGVEPGDHVILVVPEVERAVAGLFGVWAAGAVPIQVGLPFRAGGLQDLAPYLEETARRLDARALVVPAPMASWRGPATVIDIETLGRGATPLDAPAPAPGPALIQLTSGSLGRPRAAVIPGERLMRHLESISQALPPGDDPIGVSWLPLHHDMGLVGGLLYPLYNGFPVHLLSPADFRNRPYRWLETLAESRATHTAAPPAAYALASRLAARARADGVDLGALRCAMVGAEPIPPAVLRNFSRTFAACGFRPEAFFPVYGLAEATVAVTFPRPLTEPCFEAVDAGLLQREGRAVPSDGADAFEFTGVGAPIPGTEIRIAAPAGEPAPERIIGEIEVKSDSAMAGYHGDPAATRGAYRGAWLRTGDLGYLADGQLFVTGRRKELVIRAGQNLPPQAVEQTAQSVRGVRPGSTALVGLKCARRGTERAVLVAETAAKAKTHRVLVARIAAAFKARALEVDEIKLVPPHTLPRTTSGKLKRRELAASLA